MIESKMRNLKEIKIVAAQSQAQEFAAELQSAGIVVLPNLLSADQLRSMQRAFAARLKRIRWNNFDGYVKTERYRLMIEDVLLLDQGFMDLAIHPLVKQILNRYLGTNYELTEAKGWKSVPTVRDFHGWHGDAWYEQNGAPLIYREVKLAIYLTDVDSGAFNFIRGSHQRQHPRLVQNDEIDNAEVFEVKGSAGTAFLFDTSAIHRQGVPMLEERQAIFYNYHDPTVPLQQEDLSSYRYHPLLLNAAFLGNLSDEDRRILGFGNKTNFIPAFERPDRPPDAYKLFCAWRDASMRLRDARERVVHRIRRMLRQS